jgi:hypothetical protein
VRGCFGVDENLDAGSDVGKGELVREEVRAGVERALVEKSSHTSPGNILKSRGRGNVGEE